MKLTFHEILKEKIDAHTIITKLLHLRGFDEEEKKDFFNPAHPKDITPAYVGINNGELKKALLLLENAYQEKKRVVVWCDYDVDGVCGGTIMWRTLRLLGFDATAYISDRKTEGYGFSARGIEKVMKRYQPDLIISVDHGVSAEEHIRVLKDNSIPVIVTDHHLKTREDPISSASLLYTTSVCGAGVSYFVARELFLYALKKKWIDGEIVASLEHQFLYDFVTLAGIATIADMMKLTSISRSIAYHGLKNIPHITNVGLIELLKVSGISKKNNFSSFDVGFIIGPRINAAGRVGDAIVALRLLCTDNPSFASTLAKELEQANVIRQRMLSEQLSVALKRVHKKTDAVIFIHSPEFDEGIVGLIASRIMKDTYRPTLVAVESDGHIKGSARSIPGVNIAEMLKECRESLITYGGHEGAGGFSLLIDNVDLFEKKLNSVAKERITPNLLVERLEVDFATGFENVNMTLSQELKKCEPFGVGNSDPLFYTPQAFIISTRFVGKTSDHVQLVLKDNTNSPPMKAIFFGGAKEVLELDKTKPCGVVYRVGINTYRSKEELVLYITHLTEGRSDLFA